MRIRHNISSLNTNNKLEINRGKTEKVLEKLSSGFKINRAGDDAAGLAISEKMRGQIRGLDMASKNIQDGISLIQTAEGAMNEVHSLLQRGRELSVQAANDTNTFEDRINLQIEIEQIKNGIDRIAQDTEFNTKKLLNGGKDNFVEGTIENKLLLTTSNDERIMVYDFFSNATISSGFGISGDNPMGGEGYLTFSFNPNTVWDYVPLGTTLEESLDNLLTEFNNIKNGISGTANKQKLINDYSIRMEKHGNVILLISKPNVKYTGGTAQPYDSFLIEPNQSREIIYKKKGMILDTDGINSQLNFQIGANSNQSFRFKLPNITVSKLAINEVNVSTQLGSNSAINTFDNAINLVSTERSKLGAIQNRLEHTYNSVTNTSENLQSTESRIRDTDMAEEMMELTKNNILMQATQAMFAQVNQQPNSVLQLLQ
ncbi:flagellin [Lysinibacillus sp. 1P01SD]|uniref:flagellin N-terminal helical domain-containing protein n=1 Tax=Lysinibacillus sp. 1P01SD TaxID=3132285 RepID=UPI0039A1544C